MTWWMTLLVIVLVLFLIGCIPVGVDAGYSPEGYYVKLKIWLLRFTLLPRPEKPTQKKKKSAKKAEKAERPPPRKRRRRNPPSFPAGWTASSHLCSSAATCWGILGASCAWRS